MYSQNKQPISPFETKRSWKTVSDRSAKEERGIKLWPWLLVVETPSSRSGAWAGPEVITARCKILLYPSPSFFLKLPFALYLTLKPSQWFWQFVSLSLKEKQRTARPRQVCFVFRGCSPLHRRPFISRVWHPYHTNACPYQQSSRLLVYEIYCFVNTQQLRGHNLYHYSTPGIIVLSIFPFLPYYIRLWPKTFGMYQFTRGFSLYSQILIAPSSWCTLFSYFLCFISHTLVFSYVCFYEIPLTK